LNREASIPGRRRKVESPSATESRCHHPPTEASCEATPAPRPAQQTEAHLEESGFGGWVSEKTELRRPAAPLSLAERIRASQSQYPHPEHLTIPPAGGITESCGWRDAKEQRIILEVKATIGNQGRDTPHGIRYTQDRVFVNPATGCSDGPPAARSPRDAGHRH
jgi:hypothetical protein